MIKSYLKLAWKVLLRRKFFTFISLFGIAFTLVVLTLVTALMDHVVAAYPPETNHARTIGINFASTARRALAPERLSRLRDARQVRARPAERRAHGGRDDG